MTSLGRKKTESNCLANFPRTISQTSSLFRQSRHKEKIRDKTRGIVHNCSHLTCTKKYALTEGPKRGGGVTDSLSPPVIFCLLRACLLYSSVNLRIFVLFVCGHYLFREGKVFRETRSRKIESFEEQIMSKDYFRAKWRLLCLLLVLQIFFATSEVLKIGEYK